jgi:hypothetical protein
MGTTVELPIDIEKPVWVWPWAEQLPEEKEPCVLGPARVAAVTIFGPGVRMAGAVMYDVVFKDKLYQCEPDCIADNEEEAVRQARAVHVINHDKWFAYTYLAGGLIAKEETGAEPLT